jgi:hypothetical protein
MKIRTFELIIRRKAFSHLMSRSLCSLLLCDLPGFQFLIAVVVNGIEFLFAVLANPLDQGRFLFWS